MVIDTYSIITITIGVLLGCLALIGIGLNIYTKRHPFNSFYRERLTMCFSTVVFAIVSSICTSPDLVNANEIRSALQANEGFTARAVGSAVGNWVLAGYYFGVQPAFTWCIIFAIYLQTKLRQKKFKSTDISLLPSPLEKGGSYEDDKEGKQNSETLYLQSFDLQSMYPQSLKFSSAFFIAAGTGVIAGIFLLLVHGFHLLVIDSSRQSSTTNNVSLLFRGLFTSDMKATFQMGSYVYSVLSSCVRVLIISIVFGITAAQLRVVENPNKATRKRSWLKLGLTFLIDVLTSLFTLCSIIFKNRAQAFFSLLCLFFGTSATLIYFSIIPPCTILTESRENVRKHRIITE